MNFNDLKGHTVEVKGSEVHLIFHCNDQKEAKRLAQLIFSSLEAGKLEINYRAFRRNN